MTGSMIGDKIRPNILVACDHGSFIVNRFDYTISDSGEKIGQGQWLLDHGNTSTVEAQFTLDQLQEIEAPIVLDVGANIGTYSSWIAKFRPDAIVYAFEPQRLIYQMFCGNMAINNFNNVFAYNMGVSNLSSTMTMEELDYTTVNNFGAYSLCEDLLPAKSRFKSVVDITTIDEFVEKHQLPKVDFIKIDVEGMDVEVLQGAKKTIDKYRPNMLVEYDNCRYSRKDEILAELALYGYRHEEFMNNLLVTKDDQ